MAFGPLREDREETTRAMPYPFTQGPMPWPSAGNTSTLTEVNSKIFDHQDGARWWFDKVHGRWEIAGNEKKTPKFTAALSWVFYSYMDKRFYLTKKKESPGQVEFSKLPEKEKEIFRKARDKEIKSLLDSGAIKILSLRKDFPDRVLPSRYVDRWKPTEEFSVLPENFQGGTVEDEKVAPKSRWCVVGWRDPDVLEIERAAPTPLTSSMYLFMQLCACRKWFAKVKDAKTAFLQAKPTTRKNKVGMQNAG